MDLLSTETDIKDGSTEAFREMRYVQAFALVQALIDWWMASMCKRHLSWVKGKDSAKLFESNEKSGGPVWTEHYELGVRVDR